jgi:polar amino acid transport system substrate-binding protein
MFEKKQAPYHGFFPQRLLKALIFLFTISWITVGWSQKTITIRADIWQPYNDNPKGAQQGYVIDLMRAIYEKQGFVLDYQIMPWSRALGETEGGVWDCVVGASKTADRKLIYPEKSCGISRNAFFTLPTSSWTYQNQEDLAKVNLGVIANYSYSA